jgi:hypothetical protein
VSTAKISEAFDKRLGRLPHDKPIRAIVMLRAGAGRRSGASRAAKIREIRTGAVSALVDIDHILQRFDGRRLAAQPNALGYVPVEATAVAIRALADSEHVRAIIEDQSIALAR